MEAVQELTGGDTNVEFAPKEVSTLILKKYPDFKAVQCEVSLLRDAPITHHIIIILATINTIGGSDLEFIVYITLKATK